MTTNEIRSAIERKFDQLTASLNVLRSHLREVKHESRAAWESQLAELERRTRTASQQLSTYRAQGHDAWEKFQAGMEETWSSLHQACEDALHQIKS